MKAGAEASRADRRRGAAVVVVLLVLLAVTGIAHAALLTARAEAAAATVRATDLRLRTEAEQQLERALAAPLGALVRSLPLWGVDSVRGGYPPDSGAGTVRLRRLAPEVAWVRAEARDRGFRRASGGRLVWVLDPLERLRALDAVVSVGEEAPVTVGGSVETSRWAAADPPLSEELCSSEAGGAIPARPVAAIGVLPRAEAGRPGLGLLPFDSLLARTPVRVDGGGTPAPSEAGALCRTDEPWSWGDPDRPWRPCGAHLGVRAAAGNLRVDGGSGQGALVVDGDVTLTNGARFHGLVVATGMLRVHAGAELHGGAIAGGGLEVVAGSRVVGSACRVHRALAAAAVLWGERALALPGVGAVGP